MKLARVYQDWMAPPEGIFGLESEASFHLGVVLRLGAGEDFVVSDGRGRDFLAQVVHSGSRRQPLTARLLRELPSQAEPRPSIVLAVALGKGERYERLIEKAAELSVSRFVPLLTARGLSAERGQRGERWQRIARESSALSGRSRWMQVESVQGFGDVMRGRTGILLSQGGGPFSSLCRSRRQPVELWIAIGPEGGFTDEEVEQARRHGWAVAGLGPRNLRIETASLVAVTLALMENGEFEERAYGITDT